MSQIHNTSPSRPHRRRRRRGPFLWLPMAILVVALLLVLAMCRERASRETVSVPITQPTEPMAAAKEGDTLTIAAGGDINISQALLDSARQPDNSYDFSKILLGAAPLLSDADLTVADLEVNFCGQVDASMHQAPESLLTALSAAGVDLAQTANTVSVYNGIAGLSSTLDAVRQAGLTPVGTFATPEEYKDSGGYTIVECKGFRVAFVAFTKGVGNLNLPDGSEQCVNLLYTDYSTTYQNVDTEGIQAVLSRVQAEKPDITIALLHWGSEYDDEISRTQEKIRSLMLSRGVDVILGTHSHLVGPILEEDGALTAYSLGNLLSVDENSGANQGVILNLEFTKTAVGASLTGYHYDPVYLADGSETGTGRYALINTENAIGLYESSYIDRVSQEVYESLCKSRDQIARLVNPEAE